MARFDFEKLAQRLSAKRGGIPCPSCGKKKVLDFNDPVATCQGCGFRGSRTEWSYKSMRPDPEEVHQFTDPNTPPPGTRITRKEVGPDTIAWEIPPSGKSGGMLFFAFFWLAIIAIPTFAALFGKFESEGPAWIPFAFFGLFWAIGLGMLYAGLRTKFAYHLLMVDRKTVVLARSLFNQKSTKSLRRSTLKSVRKMVFYQKNYQPVYGIEVRAEAGKFRFGTTLEEEEKNWLVADLEHVLWPEKREAFRTPSTKEALSQLPVSSLPHELKPFTVTFPNATTKGSFFGLFFFLGIVATFIGIGIFVIKDAGFFRALWLGLNSLFALAGITGLVKAIKDRNKVIEVRGDRAGIHVETLRNRVPVKQESIPYSSGLEVRSFRAGAINSQTMLRIELVNKEEVLTISKWYPEDAAEQPLADLRQALG